MKMCEKWSKNDVGVAVHVIDPAVPTCPQPGRAKEQDPDVS